MPMARSPARRAYSSALAASPAAAASAKWRASSATGAVPVPYTRSIASPTRWCSCIRAGIGSRSYSTSRIRECEKRYPPRRPPPRPPSQGHRLRQPAQDALAGSSQAGPAATGRTPGPPPRRPTAPGPRRPTAAPAAARSPPARCPGSAPPPGRPLQGGLGGQQAHDLTDEQRVALGPLVDGGHLAWEGTTPESTSMRPLPRRDPAPEG